uniref:Ig-like domain-containing protein n=1 Tax=Knipowitschia caucasica TaxID=637954 RepID=A0AAV2LPN7_KNICA
MTTTKTFTGVEPGAKSSSRVLRPPGGGSNISFGAEEEKPVRVNKMASSVFAEPEDPYANRRNNPPGGAPTGVLCGESCAPLRRRDPSNNSAATGEEQSNAESENGANAELSPEQPADDPGAGLPSGRRNPPGGKGACEQSNMASSGIVLASLLIMSLMLKAKASSKFVTVSCLKSENVAQYGTSTLLDCVVSSPTTIKIMFVSWKLPENKTLSYDMGKVSSPPGFQFASSFWDEKSMNVSLLISNTNLAHAGVYTCGVMTDKEFDKANVHLIVKANYSKPQMRSEPKKVTADKSFSLTCAAKGGFPKGDIRWVVDGAAWSKNPVVEVRKDSNGLFDLTSTLTFGPDTQFTNFVCEVYNAKNEKESHQEFNNIITDVKSSTGDKNPTVINIVAPVVVIGSLIVGLLAALLFCRRRQHAAPPLDVEQCDKMIPLNAPVP